MRGNKFKLPHAVIKSVEEGRAKHPSYDPGFDLLKSSNLPNDETIIRQMHAALVANPTRMYKNEAEWMSAGGMEGLRFSRRILRKRGYIRAGSIGNVTLPSVIDLQVGPDIWACEVEKSVEDVTSALIKSDVVATCVPVESGTLILMPADVSLTENAGALAKGYDNNDGDEYALLKNTPAFVETDVDWNRATVLEVTQSRIVKTRAGWTKYQAYETDAYTKFGDIVLDDIYLLKTRDETLFTAEIAKVSDSLGLIFGWGMISTINKGAEYFDTQGHSLPHEAMLRASVDFMLGGRKHGEMHIRGEDGIAINKGAVLFAMPIIPEILEAFEWTSPTTGLAIAAKPDDPKILAKFRDGTYRGFSIEGSYDPRFAEAVQ